MIPHWGRQRWPRRKTKSPPCVNTYHPAHERYQQHNHPVQFSAIGQINLLQKLYGRLFIPTAVYDEIHRGWDEGYSFCHILLEQTHPFHHNGWIHLTHVQNEMEIGHLTAMPRKVHAGEAECLAIARHRNWLLLTDDRAARKIAASWGVALSGTLGSLVVLVERDICTLDAANRHLAQMIRQGYRSFVADLSVLL